MRRRKSHELKRRAITQEKRDEHGAWNANSHDVGTDTVNESLRFFESAVESLRYRTSLRVDVEPFNNKKEDARAASWRVVEEYECVDGAEGGQKRLKEGG